MEKNIKKLKASYGISKSAAIGESVLCPSCNVLFIKTNYQQAFCKTNGTTCKDNYWNNITPSKRNNCTRISPANARYKTDVILPNIAKNLGFPDVETMQNHVDDFDEFSVSVLPCEFCGLRYEYCQCG